MVFILLIGAALNFIGAIKLTVESILQHPEHEHAQLKWFVSGVATTFGCLYIYLFFYPQFIYPFLIFGAALKCWAFLSCLGLFVTKRIQAKLFFEFGVSNGLVALLFFALLAHSV